MIDGSENVREIEWVDNESYIPDSNKMSLGNIQFYLKNYANHRSELNIHYSNSKDGLINAISQGKSFDLIHIDGDHSYAGKLNDMNIALKLRPKYLLLDDFIYLESVRKAVEDWARTNFLDFFLIETYRGMAFFDLSGDNRVFKIFGEAGIPVKRWSLFDSNYSSDINRKCCCGGQLRDSVHPHYFQCELCGTHVARQKYSAEELSNFYTFSGYWHEHQTLVSGYPAIESRAKSDLSDRIPYWYQLVQNYTDKRGPLLEIGCAHGGFLSYCHDHGIENVVGVEVDEDTCEFARKHFQLPHVYSGLFPDVKLPVSSFNIITGFDVIEHFADPVTGITAIANLLSENGTFIFQTPCYRGEDALWEQFRPFEHLFLYNESSIKQLFTSSGLEITNILPGYFPDDMFVIGRKVNITKNIIFLRTDSIGDNILASSMLPHIRAKYPDNRITVLCQDHIVELYESSPFVDAVIGFDRRKGYQDEAYRHFILQKLRELHADLLLNSLYSRDPLYDLFAINSGARARVAFNGNLCNIADDERNTNNANYTTVISDNEKHKPELERHRDFLEGIGIQVSKLEPTIWLKAEDEEFAETFFKKNKLDPTKTVGLFAGAQNNVRIYQSYGISLSDVCKSYGLSIIGLGGSDDSEINIQNLNATGVHTINLSGKTNLRQTAAILKRCRLAVGAETGLAHMACAVGTPNVVLLGGGHFSRFMPYSPLTSIVCLPLECYGCNWQCKYSRVHCIKDINVEVLALAVRQTLAGKSDKPRVFVQGTSLWEGNAEKPHWQSFHNLLNVADVEIIPVGDIPPFTSGIWDKLRSMDRPTQGNFLKEAADEFIQHGEKLFSYNDFEGAESSFRRALELHNNMPQAFNDLGVLYTQTGDNEKALRHYEAAVNIQPENATFIKNLADFYYVVNKDTQKALELYIKGLTVNPDDIEILLTLGKLFIENRQLESAMDFYKRVLGIDPQNSDALKIIDLLNNQDQVATSGQTEAATIDMVNPSDGYLVSAIVSTYNSERFIRGCLEDLESQTIADRLEIVVVDSCSAQNERAIVEEYQRKYSNIKYIRTDKRETVYAAWNRGIKAASGKYITNANTDDRHRKDALEKLFDCLEQNPDKVLAYADSFVTTIENESFDSCAVSDRFQWPDFNKELMLNYCFIGPHPMWRKNLHEELGFFDEKYQTAADYDFWLRAARKYDFFHIKEFLGLYCLDESSVSRKGEIPLLEAKEIQKKYRRILYLDKLNGNQDRNIKRTILFVLHASPEYRYGGTEYYSFNLIKELTRLKNEVRVLYPIYDKQQSLPILVEKTFQGITAYELRSNQVNHINIENDSHAYVQLFKQVLSTTRFDIVHFHHTLGLPYIFFKVVKEYGIKSCLTLHDFWLICLNVHLLRHDVNDICDGPTSVSICADCLLSGQVHDEELSSQLNSILEKRKREVTSLLNEIDIISAPSQYVAEKFNHYLKLEKEIKISGLGLTHVKEVLHKRVSKTVRFGYFGGIAKIKNVNVLVDAFKIVKGNATLSIWGNGAADDIKKLRDNIKPDNRIQYHGGYLPDQLDDILKLIDVFCNPSLMESYSFTVREALSRNVPVISSNRGALPEIIIDHQNGLLIDPSSVTDLSSAILEIINDRQLLDRLRDNINHVLSIEEDARSWDLRYQSLLLIKDNLTSIIILTFNQLKHTKLCLQSIEKCTPQPHELILVDNGSTDGTLGYLRKYANDRNNVRVISNKENLGFAAGNNQGLAVANGNYVLMLNNDTVVTEGWLGRMLSVFERYPEVGIVGPVSNNISGPQQVKEASYRSLDDMPSFAKKWSAEHDGQSMEFQRVVGFCLLAKREVIDRIGGLDEKFGSGNFEDDDFCLRAAAVGYKARIAQNAFIHHTGSQTFKGAGINYQQSLERNWEIFKSKWKLPQDLPYGYSYTLNLDAKDLSQYYFPLPPRASTPLIIKTIPREKAEDTVAPVGRLEKMVQSELTAGNWEKAIQLLTEALNHNQTSDADVSLWNDLGYSYFMANLPQQAEIAFSDGLRINPRNFDLLNNLASLYLHQEDYDRATDYVNRALRLDPHDVGALRTLGDCAIKLARFDVALRAYEHVKKLSPATEGIDQVIADLTRFTGAYSPNRTKPPPTPSPPNGKRRREWL